MAKFFVGQRVRINYLRTNIWTELIGSCGVVVAIGGFRADHEYSQPGDYRVSCDAANGVVGQFLADQLEPLTPPRVAGSWEIIEQLLPNIREGVAA